jgi:hypothetical protein
MRPERQLQDEADCTRLCIDFAHYVDTRNYQPALDLFTEDGRFDRLGTVFSGRDDIRRFLEARPADVVTRHLCTTIRIDVQSQDAATGVCYVLFFNGKAAADGKLPIAPSAPGVVEYHDTFARTAAGWRFSERRVRLVFTS